MQVCQGFTKYGVPCRSPFVNKTDKGYYCAHHCPCHLGCHQGCHKGCCVSISTSTASTTSTTSTTSKPPVVQSQSLSKITEKIDGIEQLVQQVDPLILRMYACQSLEAVMYLAGLVLESLKWFSLKQNVDGDIETIIKQRFPFVSQMSPQFHKLSCLLKVIKIIYCSVSLFQIRQQIRQLAPTCNMVSTNSDDIFLVSDEANQFEHMTGNLPLVTVSTFDQLDYIINQHLPKVTQTRQITY